ncbi:MAG: PilC/PilY family type IV pilus protein [Burkholderiales bacterium]
MKAHVKRTFRSVFRQLVAASVALALPLQSIAQTVELATVPMANSTTTTVKPNLMFVLDDSGSMAWDYMPSEALNFNGQEYGFHSNHCNGVYYNPNVVYDPPVQASGAPLNATPTSFTAAYRNGYSTGAGTVNLNTGFTGGSGSGSSGIALTPQSAFYYTYTGTQTTPALKNYFNTSSLFYRECDSDFGAAPGSSVFTLRRLASTPTTTITVTGSGGGSVLKFRVTGASSARVNEIELADGVTDLLSATTASTSNNNTLATRIANSINACTGGPTGGCDVGGYTATTGSGADANLVTLTWNGSSTPAPVDGTNIAIYLSQGSATFNFAGGANGGQSWTSVQNPTTVSSIAVGGTNILGGLSAAGITTSALAADIRTKINAATGVTGYSATVSGSTLTVTGPSSASNLIPVIAASATPGPAMSFTTGPFPESDPAQLQNFANWYSYYSHRMLMMKTGAGLAFQNVTDQFRVGFASMNNNVPPGFLSVNTFSGAQKTSFYTKLYQSVASGSTPLREILSRTGQYYGNRFGTVDKYTATINVNGAGLTGVDSITVGGFELLQAETLPSTSQTILASNIANQINAKEVTEFGATSSGDVVTISGPASALGQTPVITGDGGTMTFAATAFVKTTTTANFNGVSPPDPIQYSCQQNFTILSTDGYWNGPNTYDLNNVAVGQIDGVAARPYNDGAQTATTYNKIYTRTTYGRTGSQGSCGSLQQPQTETVQIGSCSTTTAGASCTPANWTNDSATVPTSPQVCITSSQIPAPTLGVLQSSVETVGASGGVSNTLADVALYYYQTDLRDQSRGNCTGALGTDVCENNVFISGADNNAQQHMTTFTLGLGVRGRMVYSPSYLTDTTGDFVAVKLGSTASSSVCTWQAAGTVCNWPVPTSGSPETTDDLWHAAVNGRGAYFSATDPTTLANGLGNALVSIKSKIGAAAAAATSTLNPVAGNNQAFVASYTTQKWTGNLEARGINTDTGVVNENANWCVENVTAGTCSSPSVIASETAGDTTSYYCSTPGSTVCPGGTLVGTDCKVPMAVACSGTMNAVVSASNDTRVIKTANDAGTALIDFDLAYRAAHPAYFDATKTAGLSQWPLVSDVTALANNMRSSAHGDNLLKFLRGHFQNEERDTVAADLQFYRKREAVMGDALESQPAFMGAPVFSYPYPGYSEYKAAQAGRAGTVFIGTNDGMLHAFNADTGVERWAYIPSMVIPNLWKLADKQYQDKHTNYVNGSPITQDVCVANCSNAVTGTASDPVWKTILVAGLNAGGRGFYALDITNPNSPALLWEFTTTTGIGKVKDNDLGYSFGQPVVTRLANGTWVVLVTSGYDNGTDSPTKVSGSFVPNSPAGDGKGYLYALDAGTGTMLKKISTGVGNAANPSGLAKIAGFNAEPGGNLASYVYGGDLQGNLWRFDINSTASATVGTGSVMKFATLTSDGTATQPIMTTPILGVILGKRVVFIGTGKYLETSDLSNTQVQTQYAIKDDDATATLVNARSALVQQFLIANPDGTATRLSATSAGATTTGVNTVDFGVNRGWFVDLPDSKERINIDARLVLGTLIVPSIVPSSTACSPGGFGWLNFLDYRTGGSVTPTPGLASVRYDSTIVGINVLYIAGNPVVEVVTSSNPTPTKDPNVQFQATVGVFTGKRVLWRELVP